MALMSEMKVVARSLLDLPVEIKLRNANPVHGKGYTPPNCASPFFEGMGVYDMASNGAVDDFCDLLGASPHQRLHFSLSLSLSLKLHWKGLKSAHFDTN